MLHLFLYRHNFQKLSIGPPVGQNACLLAAGWVPWPAPAFHGSGGAGGRARPYAPASRGHQRAGRLFPPPAQKAALLAGTGTGHLSQPSRVIEGRSQALSRELCSARGEVRRQVRRMTLTVSRGKRGGLVLRLVLHLTAGVPDSTGVIVEPSGEAGPTPREGPGATARASGGPRSGRVGACPLPVRTWGRSPGPRQGT